jgi:hypothetical protein
MYEDKSAGASYLSSLKKATPQAGAAAPGLAPDGTSGAAPGASEKRRSPRYRCQGSANLRDLHSGVATWATFTDISQHGCYVEAMSGFRVATELSMRIEVNGYSVECNGEVRVVYPGLGMGITFTIMAEEQRERLRDLLRSLTRPSGILGNRLQEPKATPEPASTLTNPEGFLQAITNFFKERQMLSREEFERILRKSQS